MYYEGEGGTEHKEKGIPQAGAEESHCRMEKIKNMKLWMHRGRTEVRESRGDKFQKSDAVHGNLRS